MSRRESRLSEETSPYLLKHASNPVDWFPWTQEALEKAKSENKPIFLSIGYSACHWCHVMERESFQNEKLARLLNQHFVSIKVDREERPDLDDIYMAATIALNGSGGWPMNVFLTPDTEPFFAGTYFPPQDQEGRPGFDTLLTRIQEMWAKEKDNLEKQARDLTAHVRSTYELSPSGSVSEDSIRAACRSLEQDFDPSFGGFGRAPKFPPAAALRLLLRHHRHTGQGQFLRIATRTLDGMMTGGIYDQIGGGFCRYSVDSKWLVPHFEKMLSDNALLADVYIEAFQATSHAPYRRVAQEVLDYTLREMQSPDGGFFSSSDADSEGGEGAYFCFTRDEIKRVVGEPHATYFSEFFGVTTEGNFNGTNVLSTRRTLQDVARALGVAEPALVESLEHSKAQLFAARQKRTAPAIDDKVIASFNGLLIRALANAGRAFSDGRYLEAAMRAAEFILGESEKDDGMRKQDGRLLRSSRAGIARIDGFLDDYAFVADGLLSLYEAGAGARYLAASIELTDTMLELFHDEHTDALYFTPRDHDDLITRPCDARDSAIPNANAVACRVLTRLAAHTDNATYRDKAEKIAAAFSSQLKRSPRAHLELLNSVELLLHPPLEVVLSGSPTDERWTKLATTLGSQFLPHRIETRITRDNDITALSPLTRGRLAQVPSVFLCQNYTCELAITDAETLRAALSKRLENNSKRRKKELRSKALLGAATAEATATHLRACNLGGRQLDGLSITSLGIGTHRVGLDNPRHREALEAALLGGMNLIDTSPSFALGDSERLIGQVLAQLVDEEKLDRSSVVIVSKVGVALGAEAERLEQRRMGRDGAPLNFAVPLGGTTNGSSSLASGAFCLDPAFLVEQLASCRERLGLKTLDYCLLQSPEHLLAAGRSRSELNKALEAAFLALEDEIERGRLQGYGVLTNTLTQNESYPTRLTVKELLDAATQARHENNHFRLLALPVNLLESEALKDKGPLADAASAGLSVLSIRPLSATAGDALLRLADPRPSEDGATADSLKPTRYRVASLEAEFETTFATQLRLAGKASKEAVLPLTGPLGHTLEQVQTLQQFELAEATLLTPRLRQLLAQLDRALSGPGEQNWHKFKNQYIEAVGAWLAAIRETASDRNRTLLNDLDVKIDDSCPFREARKSPWWEEADWVERALRSLIEDEKIHATVVGLRAKAHVNVALSLLKKSNN